MFDFFRREKKPNPDASRLLASILVVYPSVQSVTYDSKSDMLELSFALNGKFSQDDFEDFLSHVAESVETFHHIEGLGGAKIELDVEGVYGTCFLNVRRDMSTLTCRELSLLTELAQNYFGENLIEECEGEMPDEEYIMAQEDYLEQCLNNIRQLRIEGRLVGVREQERVVVYAR
ncbi:MAG: hypothetical protein IJU91_00420 [Selenomonadaceae bacterium]|nr:hypothetical protein [Selenomonadaceae bacterium]